jgi:hypothetical protein
MHAGVSVEEDRAGDTRTLLRVAHLGRRSESTISVRNLSGSARPRSELGSSDAWRHARRHAHDLSTCATVEEEVPHRASIPARPARCFLAFFLRVKSGIATKNASAPANTTTIATIVSSRCMTRGKLLFNTCKRSRSFAQALQCVQDMGSLERSHSLGVANRSMAVAGGNEAMEFEPHRPKHSP